MGWTAPRAMLGQALAQDVCVVALATLHGRRSLLDVPDHVVLAIMEMLDADDICRLRAVCARLLELADDVAFVQRVLRRDFGDVDAESDDGLHEHSVADWRSYQAHYGAVQGRRRMRVMRKHHQEAMERRERLQRLAIHYFTFFHDRVVSVALPLLALVGVICIGLKLDGSISWAWSTVLWPWFVMAAVIWIGVSTLVSVSVKQHHWLFDQIVTSEWSGCLSGLSRDIVRGGVVANAVALLMCLCLTLQIILIALRLDAIVLAPWSVILLPLWITYTLVCVAPCSGWVLHSERLLFFGLLWAAALTWFFVFTILLTIHLDQGILSLSHVFIPLWIVDGIFIAVAFIAVLSAFLDFLSPCSIFGCTLNDVLYVSAYLGVAIVVFAPLAVVKSLIIYKIISAPVSLSYIAVLSPLIIWFGLAACCSFTVTLVVE